MDEKSKFFLEIPFFNVRKKNKSKKEYFYFSIDKNMIFI
jgi:hypothetical protein